MLRSAPGGNSALGLPAIVTRPGFSGCLYCRWLPAVVTRYQPSASISLIISRTFRGNDHSILDGRRFSWDDPRSGAPCTSTLRDPCDSGSSPAGSLRRRNSGISRHYSTSGDQDAPGQRQDDRGGEELIEGGHVELRGGPGPDHPGVVNQDVDRAGLLDQIVCPGVLLRSAATKRALPPSALMASATAVPRASRPCTMTSAPCRASGWAAALPIPDVAPVTSARRPSRSRSSFMSCPSVEYLNHGRQQGRAGIRYMTAHGGSLRRGQHGDGASHVPDGRSGSPGRTVQSGWGYRVRSKPTAVRLLETGPYSGGGTSLGGFRVGRQGHGVEPEDRMTHLGRAVSIRLLSVK
jgi:hypothetical protein